MARKRGLGRGLDSLLGAKEDVKETIEKTERSSPEELKASGEDLRSVPIDLIERGQYQPRRVIDEDSIEELAESIRQQGILQPIVLRLLAGGERYEIIAGERRWRASQKVGLSEIPALIKDVPDEAAIAMALIENIQRENLNPMEEALALQRLKQEFKLTHDEVAKAVGKSRSAVTNLMRLSNLQEAVRTLVENGDLEMGHARALLALEGPLQLQAARETIEKELSVRQTESLVKALQAKPTKKAPKKKSKSADVESLENSLSDKLGTSVAIEEARGGGGKLVISYSSVDILEGILKHIK